MSTTTFYRVVGARELELIQAAGWLKFPTLPDGIARFHAASQLDDAIHLAEVWKVPAQAHASWQDAEAWDAEWGSVYPHLPAEWLLWGNDAQPRYVVSFELPDSWPLGFGGLSLSADELPRLNAALVGLIEIARAFAEEPA